jgi:ABC-type branched-subunit amino acid transport system ATPase component
MTSGPLLELDDIVAGYVAGIDILAGVRLKVEAGSVTGIIGPNGAGKSTLLKTIFGFLHPRRGRIVFDGQAVESLAPHAVKRRGIGYVPQGTNIFPQLTVQENLELGAWIFRRDASRVAGMLDRAYTSFPRLAQKRTMRATALSGGEAKMLSIAKEMMTDPRLLLVDEPSAGLSPKLSDQVYIELVAARAQGVTILLVDQNIAKAVEISEYLYMLEMGQVRREGPRADFAEQLRDIIRDSLLGV